MEDEIVTIPRNIKVREIVAYGLNGKQVLYLVAGVGGTLFMWSLGIPIDLKIASSVACIASSLFLSLAKANGQELDKYIMNTIKYPLRQKTFGGENNKRMVVSIRYTLES